MTANATIEPLPTEAAASWHDPVAHPWVRLVARWIFIAALTSFAFHRSIVSLYETTRAGGTNGYVWTLPLLGILAAQGVSRRHRTELPIHDRQTDVIVGAMGLGFALMLHGVLLQRYALYFNLLRLDLLAMWAFVISASIVLFGLRPVSRFWEVWLLMLAVFTLPYQLVTLLLGGNRVSAGATNLLIASAATAISVGRTWPRSVVGGLSAVGVGVLVLALMALFTPDAPFFGFQMIPSLTATCLVGLSMFVIARRGAPMRILDRKVEPLAAKQVWASVPLVVIVAVLLAMVPLPGTGSPPPARIGQLGHAAQVKPPPGWHSTSEQKYKWVTRLYGRSAVLVRQHMVADVGNPKWDKLSHTRTLVVDSVTTVRPFTLSVYPAKVLYRAAHTRMSMPRRVDLGFGVTGEIVSVIEEEQLVTWNILQWTWQGPDSAQRVLVFAVDDHEDDAPFPEPTGGGAATLNTLFTVLFRGNAAVADRDPSFKDADLLATFGRAVVEAEMTASGVMP